MGRECEVPFARVRRVRTSSYVTASRTWTTSPFLLDPDPRLESVRVGDKGGREGAVFVDPEVGGEAQINKCSPNAVEEGEKG